MDFNLNVTIKFLKLLQIESVNSFKTLKIYAVMYQNNNDSDDEKMMIIIIIIIVIIIIIIIIIDFVSLKRCMLKSEKYELVYIF